ncbi:hypothetical protein TRFO_19875 [Tritrichomonas foetus]|uniref:Uncharacterized protein n=1 Tax=Tritrichomonas foetus TaxID=1144522 RepID=A0A1J4KH50_9EUKA|nr:hypothetical protein TRFO_19875 [Tritrichomonas foetus]|eukprot:OHT10743.1 hypothetical protein TRFO_19875 [Tritrichomonas foetus]
MKVSPKPKSPRIAQHNLNSPTYRKPTSSTTSRIRKPQQPLFENNKSYTFKDSYEQRISPQKSDKKKISIESYSTYSEDVALLSDQSFPEDANEEEISTQIELKRAYEECIEVLQKSNDESNIIISDMKQLIEDGVEAHSVTFSNNKIKRDSTDIQKYLKKTRENYKFLCAQRNAIISIDLHHSKQADISNAIFALQMENSLISETCLRMNVDIQELNSRIQALVKEVQKNTPSKTRNQSPEDRIIQYKIEQFSDNLKLLNSVKMPDVIENTEYENNTDFKPDKSLLRARGMNSMMMRFGYDAQSNFIKIISQFEDISEKCSLIWPKLNGFDVDEKIMRQFMNEMWEQAALNDQIRTLQFHTENVLKNANVKYNDTSLSGLTDALRNAINA